MLRTTGKYLIIRVDLTGFAQRGSEARLKA